MVFNFTEYTEQELRDEIDNLELRLEVKFSQMLHFDKEELDVFLIPLDEARAELKQRLIAQGRDYGRPE